MNTESKPHTPEPWHYQEKADSYTHIVRAEDGQYLFSGSTHSSPIVEANLRRAADCVNACAGMADPAKEVAALREALRRAVILAQIADDWHLGSDGLVEIDGVWIAITDLRDEFRATLTERSQP